MSRRVQPTEEEVNTLPFNATDFEVYYNEETQVRSQFANWNDQQIQRYQQGPWENYHNDKPLTLDDWEKHYPFISEIQELDRHTLTGTYRNKQVRWSRTQGTWVYLNHRPVNFYILPEHPEPTPEGPTPAHTPTPVEPEQQTEQRPKSPSEHQSGESSDEETSDDEAQVSEILDRTAQAITQLTTSISRQGTPTNVTRRTSNNPRTIDQSDIPTAYPGISYSTNPSGKSHPIPSMNPVSRKNPCTNHVLYYELNPRIISRPFRRLRRQSRRFLGCPRNILSPEQNYV